MIHNTRSLSFLSREMRQTSTYIKVSKSLIVYTQCKFKKEANYFALISLQSL